MDAKGAPVSQDTESEQLYLNPGAADHTPWPMSDGSTVAGQAALLIVRGKRAMWQGEVTTPSTGEPVRFLETLKA